MYSNYRGPLHMLDGGMFSFLSSLFFSLNVYGILFEASVQAKSHSIHMYKQSTFPSTSKMICLLFLLYLLFDKVMFTAFAYFPLICSLFVLV